MSAKPELFLVCQPFHPDSTAVGQLFSPLMRQLKKRDIEITVFCGFPSQRYAQNAPRKEIWEGIKIRRCGLRLSFKQNILFRLLTYVTFSMEALFRLLRSPRSVCWLGVTNPPFVCWVLGVASILRQRSFNYFFLDIYPEGLIALGEFQSTNWFIRFWKLINHWAYYRADHLLVLGRDMIPLLAEQYDLPIKKFVYLPHWSAKEFNSTYSFEDSKYTKSWNLKDKFVVQYSGNMGLWHDIDTIVRAAKELEKDPHIHFVFVGDGRRRKLAEQLSVELSCSNIQWHDFVPLDELSDSLSACHVSLISLRSGLEGVAVPCKLYGILAAGRAVVAQVPDNSEVALTVLEHDCGMVLHPGDVNELVKVLKNLSRNQDQVELMGRKAFKAYEQNFRLENAVDSLKSVLKL